MIAQSISTTAQANLTVEKGIAEYDQEIKKLTAIAWHIVYTALWNTLDFSKPEKENATGFISSFLQQANNHRKAYSEFIQRVLLARMYISTHPGSYIPLPSKWLHAGNKKGFAGTEQWFNTIQGIRESLPQYKITIKAFAEAVFESVETGNPADFHYWRSYFIQQNAQGLLNLFLSTIANYNNSIDNE